MSFWCRPADWLRRLRRKAASVRASHLTGFSDQALEAFAAVQPGASRSTAAPYIARWVSCRKCWRLSSQGRLYSTLCEFQTQELMPEGEDASAIIGIVGTAGGFARGPASAALLSPRNTWPDGWSDWWGCRWCMPAPSFI